MSADTKEAVTSGVDGAKAPVSAVQNILADSISAVNNSNGNGTFPSLVSSQWYRNSSQPGSASSSLSCLSLPAAANSKTGKIPSKIPLPSGSGGGGGGRRSAGRPTLRREGSSPSMLVANAKLSLANRMPKTAPPPVPPKPTHLKARRDQSLPTLQQQQQQQQQQKPMLSRLPLKRESSSPPSLDQPLPPPSPCPSSSSAASQFGWRPPRPRREASFDSLASSSRIPVWRGSQERIGGSGSNSSNNKRKKMWESCAEVRVPKKKRLEVCVHGEEFFFVNNWWVFFCEIAFFLGCCSRKSYFREWHTAIMHRKIATTRMHLWEEGGREGGKNGRVPEMSCSFSRLSHLGGSLSPWGGVYNVAKIFREREKKSRISDTKVAKTFVHVLEYYATVAC